MPAKIVDLHTHSTASDGTLSPGALISMAKDIGLAALALTDHDTINGLAEAEESARRLGIEFIPGVELSALYERGTLHILGYFLDYNSSSLITRLRKLQQARAERNPKIIQKLQALGIDITMEEVEAIASSQIGRPHIARLLVEKRVCRDINEAFDRFLKAGAAAYVPKERLSAPEAIELIHQARGLAVLAHPITLNISRPEALKAFVKGLVKAGLDGIESYYSDHDEAFVGLCQEIAEAFDLVETGGTDFHGANKPHIKLGFGRGSLRVPYEAVEALKKCWQRRYSGERQ
ncbi:PHP domain-containing protein [Thermosulfuriphilus sp.]